MTVLFFHWLLLHDVKTFKACSEIMSGLEDFVLLKIGDLSVHCAMQSVVDQGLMSCQPVSVPSAVSYKLVNRWQQGCKIHKQKC